MTIRQLPTRSFANEAITSDKIANSAITSAKIATGTITIDKLDAQTQANINQGGASKANVADLTTANVSELTNLYFTNARARGAISVSGAGTYDSSTGVINITGGVTSVGGATGAVSNAQLASSITSTGLLNTSNVVEGSNQYFTNARTYSNVTQLNYATVAYVDSAASPRISNVTYPADDLAVSPSGGETVTLTGSGFKNGATVYIGTTIAPTVSFNNSTSLSFTTPALSAGTYLLYVINPDGSTGIGIPGLSVSGVPTWSTAAGALANATESAYSTTINATSDSNVSYTIISGALPSGFNLNANTGIISGTLTSNVANLSSNTTYNITIDAKDLQNQNTSRAFSITYIPTYPTWITPNAGALTSGEVGSLYTANLNAISNSAVTYTIPSGNLVANIAISGNQLTGTPPEANTYYFTIRATDAEGHSTDRNFNVNFAVQADSNFRYTTLLLNGDGSNGTQNNTFLDSSSNTFAITRNGNTAQGTFSPFSQTGWSYYFDGSSDSFTVPTGTDLNFGSGSFTVEFWLNPVPVHIAGLVGNASIGSGTGWGIWQFAVNSSQSPTTRISVSFNGTNWFKEFQSASMVENQWNHVAVVKSGTTVTVYINGASAGSFSDAPATITDGETSTGVGIITGWNAGGYPLLNGYMSNLRVVKGATVYTGTFTPPTAPLSAFGSGTTSLLTCQSNRFIDNSSANKTLTITNNTSVAAFSPFAPTDAYSAATNGGSGYFDATTSDYLQTPSSSTFDLPSTSDWQIDFWYYPFNLPDTFHGPFGGTNANGIFFANRGGFLDFVNGNDNAGLIRSNYPTLNAWAHIVLVNRGSTNQRSVFINGSRTGTITNNYTFTNDKIQIITGSSPKGYISNFRILKGARTFDPASTTLTVPTAPTTSTGSTTILLLNFTNAGIIDQTGKNVLQTVGNAQINTSTKKFGTGSLAFDGTGDYLTHGSNQNASFGTGNFTIEAWIYWNNLDSESAIMWGKGVGWTFYIYPGNKLQWGRASPQSPANLLTGNTTLSTGQWYHIAVTRSGTTVTLWVNGVSDGTVTDSANYSASGNIEIGWSHSGGSFNGFMDDVRVTKGIARYTSTFTPPTAAFALK